LDELVQSAQILALNGWDDVLAAHVNTVEKSGKKLCEQVISPDGKNHRFQIRQPLLVDTLLVNAHLFVL
jgi:hypothetical protein